MTALFYITSPLNPLGEVQIARLSQQCKETLFDAKAADLRKLALSFLVGSAVCTQKRCPNCLSVERLSGMRAGLVQSMPGMRRSALRQME